jgi:UDPglucose 6-dehydrogenase
MEALPGADALVIVTEWKAYRSPDFAALKAAIREPVIFDGRNLYEPRAMREAGVQYFGIGRNSR